MPELRVIFRDRLTQHAYNEILNPAAKGQDLTKGMNFPGVKKALLGSSKKVKVFYYDGKPDFYKNRRARNYNAIIKYEERLNITIIAIL